MNKLLPALIICLVSCSNETNKNNSNIVSIEITYIKGFMEKPIPYPCGALTSVRSALKIDTILNDSKKTKEIEHQIEIIKELNTDSMVSGCDVRIQFKVNFKNGEAVKLCIGRFNCLIKDSKRMTQNDTLVYLIKKYSGYYDYFPKEDLIYFDELKHFGVPDNYKDLSEKKNLNGPPIPPR